MIMTKEWLPGELWPDDPPLPTSPGWYPVLHQWEAPEGYSPKAGYFDGKNWLCGPNGLNLHGSLFYLNELQPDKESAEKIAKENDVNI